MSLQRKLNVKIFLMFIVAENTGSVNIMKWMFLSYGIYETSRVFISPSLWRGDIKRTSFINTIWNENSFQILYITCLTRKKVRKLSFHTDFTAKRTRQCRDVTYDVIDKPQLLGLQSELLAYLPTVICVVNTRGVPICLGLSKCFPALCHKLIHEIAIFHSVNGEISDKLCFNIMIIRSQYNYI